MKDGFLKVAAVSPKTVVANCAQNASEVIRLVDVCRQRSAKFIVFPELCITGYTCSDLFLQDTLLNEAKNALLTIAKSTKNVSAPIIVGLPLVFDGKLFNCAAVLLEGKIIAVVPKTYIPNYTEYYESRHFTSGFGISGEILIGGDFIPFGTDIIFTCENMPDFSFAVEICEDVWLPSSPSESHALAGALLIANLSASNEIIGKKDYRRNLISTHSGKCLCGYVYASAGDGESSTDLVFSGHNLICENGVVLSETYGLDDKMWGSDNIAVSEIDLSRLSYERRRLNSFVSQGGKSGYRTILFDIEENTCDLTRFISSTPFVPSDKVQLFERCDEILNMQTMALIKRLNASGAKTAVVAVSGGLDSALTLLIAARAVKCDICTCKEVTAITMPGPGTTNRTLENAIKLIENLGAKLIKIPIDSSLQTAFNDIEHSNDNHDTTFENTQARLRMTIGMNIANKENGILLGTSDLSELALGWTTYSGDHMSMYNVNCSVPKTLVRYLVKYIADSPENEILSKTLNDILNTPVSPELIPSNSDEIEQKTEEILGPYRLHDFFLYYGIRFGFIPEKVKRLAVYAFKGEYSEDEVKKALKIFYKRFFANQFKRSCVPDGVKIGSISLSPRSDWRMPSDADGFLWTKDFE